MQNANVGYIKRWSRGQDQGIDTNTNTQKYIPKVLNKVCYCYFASLYPSLLFVQIPIQIRQKIQTWNTKRGWVTIILLHYILPRCLYRYQYKYAKNTNLRCKIRGATVILLHYIIPRGLYRYQYKYAKNTKLKYEIRWVTVILLHYILPRCSDMQSLCK